MRLLRSCLLVVPVVVLVACTSSAPADPEPAGSLPSAGNGSEVAAALAEMYAGDHPRAADRREGECFADSLLSTTTREEMQQGGLLDASYDVITQGRRLSDDLATRVADAQLACTDFVADSAAAQVAITKGKVDAAAYSRCLRKALTSSEVRAGLVASLTGSFDDPALERLSRAQSRCVAAASPG